MLTSRAERTTHIAKVFLFVPFADESTPRTDNTKRNTHIFLFSFLLQMAPEEKEAQEYIRRFTHRWCLCTWCTLLRKNISTCATDTREGVLTPHATAAARSGPPPSLERGSFSGEVSASSAKTPTSLPNNLITVGARAKIWGGIATPGRRLPRNNRGVVTGDSFNLATGGVSSGRGVIQKGDNSSAGKLGSPIDLSVDQLGFFSRRRHDNTTNNDSLSRASPSMFRGSVKVNGAASGREMIQRSHDSSWRIGNLWTTPFTGKRFGSTERDHIAMQNASPTESSVLESKPNGDTLSMYRDGTDLKNAVCATDAPSCDELPPPPRYASSRLGDDPSEHAQERSHIARSGQTEHTTFDDGQRDRQLPQPLPALRDVECGVPPQVTENGKCANLPMVKHGGNSDALAVGLLWPRPSLGPSSSSVCSLGMSRGSDHRLNSKASRVVGPSAGRIEDGIMGRMDPPALPKFTRCPIAIDTPVRFSKTPISLPPAACSDCWTDSNWSHGTDDESSDGPGAALRGITAVFKKSTDVSDPRRKSFSSAPWEPPPDESGTSVLNEGVLERKKLEQEKSLRYLNRINLRAWDDLATIKASWKHAPSALDHPRWGSNRRMSREASRGTVTSSSWRSYQPTEGNLVSENKSGVCGDGETAVRGWDRSHRDMFARGQKSGRGGASVLAKLVSQKRVPVQSDVPRRRSVEISLRMNNGVDVVPIADVASGGDSGGRKSSSGDERTYDSARALAFGNPNISTSIPERGWGGRPHLQSGTPVDADRELNNIGGSSRAELEVNGSDEDDLQMVQGQQEGEIGRGSTDLADSVGVASPAQQGSRKDSAVDGAGEGTSIFPVKVVKGRGIGLLTQYSNGFEDADEYLNGDDEGKVVAW